MTSQAPQRGQSLVEFIIVIPIFFLFLSGMIFIFFNQIRNFTDDHALISLQISQSGFEPAERTQAHWRDPTLSHQNVLNASLNPSLLFTSSRNRHDDVFQDKKHIYAAPTSASETFSVQNHAAEHIGFTTSAPLTAYENASFDFMEPFSTRLNEHVFSAAAIFAPTDDFQWKQRSNEVISDTRSFALRNMVFMKEYASLHYPQDNSQFNANCFMSPLTPQCRIHPLQGKMTRSAQDGANIQVLGCAWEMEQTCATTACTAEGVAEIVSALKLGIASISCPKINQLIRVQYAKALSLTLEKTQQNVLLEGTQRQRLQIP